MSNPDEELGLQEVLKNPRRIKIAKIDQDRLLGETGLPYLVKNHQKVTRIIKKHDKRKPVTKQEKYNHEYENLSSVLQFYQLWCHTLFPKANFKDCILLIRGVTNRSPRLRLYRRELIEQELQKLRAKEGLVGVPLPTESGDSGETGTTQRDVGVTEPVDKEEDYYVDDDFSFMQRGNGLFVDPDGDDMYEADVTTHSETTADTAKTATTGQTTETAPTTQTAQTVREPETQAEFSDFSDDEQFLLATQIIPNETNEANDDYDAELEVMNELGM